MEAGLASPQELEVTMLDSQKILTQVLGETEPSELSGRLTGTKSQAGRGLLGLLLGRKKGSGEASKASKVGGLAVLGSIARRALLAWRSESGMSDPAPSDTNTAAFWPETKAGRDELSRALLSAMIAAAKADGHIDAVEQTRIFQKLDQCDLNAEEKDFLVDELRKPLDTDAVAAQATTPERALEIYAASLLAIDTEGSTEREYLADLARKLHLDPALTRRIEEETENAAA
jgi:uncharacterized membrane protein YebE (DUF533 family)